MKLKGGILYYSLLVIILTSSLVGFVLLNAFYDNTLLTDTIKQGELRRNVISAINLFLTGEVVFENRDSAFVDIFDKNQEKVLLTKRKWGNYYIINSSSRWRKKHSERIALIGSDLTNQEPVALYMPDEGRILTLNGNTVIKGTCYLPEGTARVSSIEGQQFLYKDPIQGIIKKSPPVLPGLNDDLLSFADFFLNTPELNTDSLVNILDLDSTNIFNSFGNRTLFIFNDTLSSIGNFSLSGNVILWSVRPIEIENTTTISDIIIFAPQIRIKSGFKGELQAYAVQSIIVEDSCRIAFPSQLCIVQAEKASYRPSDTLAIKIGQNSLIEGGIVFKSFGLFSSLKISKGASASGQVYCPGLVELSGSVNGSLYCRTFFLETSRTRYYNHLLNAHIDYKALSEHFTGTDMITRTVQKSVIKWLE